MATTYLLNTPVLTGYGDYRFEGPLGVERAREILAAGFTSAIGHAETAIFLGRLFGMPIAHQRISISMEPGDQALVFRITSRLPEGKVLNAKELEAMSYEFVLITRL